MAHLTDLQVFHIQAKARMDKARQEEEDRARSIRIEQKLDILIAALAEEQGEEDTAQPTLDGFLMGGERDQSRPL